MRRDAIEYGRAVVVGPDAAGVPPTAGPSVRRSAVSAASVRVPETAFGIYPGDATIVAGGGNR